MAVDLTTSMVTTEEAVAYLEGRLDSDAWDQAQPERRDKALRTATRQLNNLTYVGIKADADQAHAFPRTYTMQPAMDARMRGDGAAVYTEDAIPAFVKEAVCEHALFLLEQTPYERHRARQQAQGIVSSSQGKASEQSTPEQITKGQWGSRIAPEAFRILSVHNVLATAGDLV